MSAERSIRVAIRTRQKKTPQPEGPDVNFIVAI